jgi:pyrimidine-specific ribonucleoside hydrolase
MKNKIDIIWDMETGDPDDVLNLCLMSTHPRVNLVAVTVNPGSNQQIGIAKYILGLVDKPHIPVGSRSPGYEKSCVSGWYDKWLGPQNAEPDGEGCDVMYEALQKYPDAVLLTGAALTNPGNMLRKYPDVRIKKWVGQGGFAGDNVVPPEHRMEKFAGMVTCPTYNFNGDPKSALLLLESDNIEEIVLVSKNVCHGVVYDGKLHERLIPHVDKHRGLTTMWLGMNKYLQKHNHKKWHDPLAFYAVLEPHEFEWRSVKLYREKGKWGSINVEGSNTEISIKAPDDIMGMFY